MNITDPTIRLSRLAFAAACAVGLAGTWIGLGYHSLWFDELATAGIIGADHDLAAMFARNFAETNPPIYYVALFYFTQIAGMGDEALRAFSAFFGCASIVVFVLATRGSFSLTARLFGAALATGSYFWFFQSQNVRCYTLGLTVSAAIVGLALSLLHEPEKAADRGKLAALATAMLIGAFVHFYVVYQGLGVLLVLLLYRRNLWLYVGATGFLLLGSSFFYLHFIALPYTQIDPNNFWVPHTLDWYPYVLRQTFHQEWRRPGALALTLCVAAIVMGHFLQRRQSAAGPSLAASMARDPAIALGIAVPLVVLGCAFLSGLLIAPSFSDRSFLTSAPFLWALSARLYDRTLAAPITKHARAALDAALAACVLVMATVVVERTSAPETIYLWSEPYRQTADWIRAQPSCRNAMIPIIVLDPKAWYRGDYAERVFGNAYEHYLAGYAAPRLVFFEDVLARHVDSAVAAELKERLDGRGCPVIGTSAHGIYEAFVPDIRSALLRALDHPDTPAERLTTLILKDGWWGFIFAAKVTKP